MKTKVKVKVEVEIEAKAEAEVKVKIEKRLTSILTFLKIWIVTQSYW
jgi:hypothetical protein